MSNHDVLHFLNWRPGYEEPYLVKSYSCLTGDADLPTTEIRRWAWIKDGPRLKVGYENRAYEVEFFSARDARSVRRFIKESPKPFLVAVEINGTNDPVDGQIRLFRGSEPGILEPPLSVVASKEILDSAELSQDDHGANRLARQMMLTTPEETMLLVEVPTLVWRLLDDPDRQSVRVYLHSGKVLTCDLHGAPGQEYLVARACESCGLSPQKVKMVSLNAPPYVLLSAEAAKGSRLTPLHAKRFELLEAWIAYESVGFQLNEALFKSRLDHPIEYAEHDDIPRPEGTFALRVSNPSDVRDHWIDKDHPSRSPLVKIGAAVEIRGIGSSAPSKKQPHRHPADGELQALLIADDRVFAIFRPRSSSIVPPAKGRIIAVEDYGDITQRTRKKVAIEALVHASTAAPDLLGQLMRPESIPPVGGKGLNYWRRPGMPYRLSGAMRKAVVQAAKSPDLFLVQGPPGTGKTTFIVELVHQVLHRHRNRNQDGDDGIHAGMPNILISSTQKAAVANLRERLSSDNVYVSHIESVRHKSEPILSNQVAASILGKFRKLLEDSASFASYTSLRRFSDQVSEAADTFLRDGPTDHLLGLLAVIKDQGHVHMTPSMNDSLEKAIDGWLCATSRDQTVDSGEEACKSRHCSVPEDVCERFASIGEHVDLVSITDLGPVIDKLITHVENAREGADDRLRDLTEQWRDCKGQVSLAIKRNRLSNRATSAVSETIRETLSYTRDRDGKQVEPPTGDMSRAEVATAVNALGDWLARAVELLSLKLEGLSETEDAVFFDWLTAFEQEPGTIKELMDRYSPITTATCLMAAKTGRNDTVDQVFDIVIVDEAARAGIEVLIPMVLGRSVILIGDQKQLPPHLEDQFREKMDQNILESVDLSKGSLFQWLWDHIPASNKISLNMQYRMHEDIGRIVSRVFYEGDREGITLKHHYSGDRAKERVPVFELCGNHPVVWLDTSDALGPGASIDLDRHRFTWPCHETNPYEIHVIMQLLTQLDTSRLSGLTTGDGPPVGVITFYGAQHELITQELKRLDSGLSELVQTGTVDGFQGQEFPLVILSAVRSNDNGFTGFLKMPNRINVAMSRAQRQLIIVGDCRTLAPSSGKRGSMPFRKVLELIRDDAQPGRIFASREVCND